VPRQDGNRNGRIARYEVYASLDASDWGTAVATGTFADRASAQDVTFAAKHARYVRLRALSEAAGQPFTSVAELNVFGQPLAVAAVIPQEGWRLEYVDSQNTASGDVAANAFDGNPATIWHSQWSNGQPPPPHEIQIDLGSTHAVSGFRYLPRQDGSANGRIGRYEFYVSQDGRTWGSPIATGTFPDTSTEQEVAVAPVSGRYVRLRALTETGGRPFTSIAELNVLGR
jgi:endo-alpha-N-acetylgalactosaminidase